MAVIVGFRSTPIFITSIKNPKFSSLFFIHGVLRVKFFSKNGVEIIQRISFESLRKLRCYRFTEQQASVTADGDVCSPDFIWKIRQLLTRRSRQ
ncbi:hypothetical protein L6452_04538 [Arctium lappa]|uniref:Uncharacterized protein n=1 Tax=Arctium lappa TaxID=4217 RepID=A0ACB9EDT5_ARCLA|nr:hypothetical protein L6452_04538 [Arctium lappa]